MVIDSEVQKRNCKEYADSHYKAIDVLRESNGKQSYKDIAKKLSIPDCKVSSLQKKANKFELVRKLDNNLYKKVPGVLGLMPVIKTKEKKNIVVQDIIAKSKKRKPISSITMNTNISQRIVSPCEKMVTAYRSLYLTENTLRELVRKVFQSVPNWWQNRVPPAIQINVQKTISETPYHVAQRYDELEYAHIGQLKEIIIAKKNWNDFLPYLKEKNKSAFDVTINRAIPSRNSIGHCIPLNPKDLKKIDVRFGDILDMLK